LGELVFVGLGLSDESDISLKGLMKAKEADAVFAEFYTSFMPKLDVRKLESLVGKHLEIVSRKNLEDERGKRIFEAAKTGKAVLLVPGDPLIATTHIDLRIQAEKNGIKTSIVHSASIVSAVIGMSGLQNYKFGRSVTIPFTETERLDPTPYNVIAKNQEMGLHTLCFLDIRAEEKRYMHVSDALKVLTALEEQNQKRVITFDTLAIGLARAGSENPTVKSDYIDQLRKFDFGKPPHTLVFPGRLHFMEAEALVTLANAPERVKEMAK